MAGDRLAGLMITWWPLTVIINCFFDGKAFNRLLSGHFFRRVIC